jgi:hypothetical protein
MKVFDESSEATPKKWEYVFRVAKERYEALSPEQKVEHDRKQRESFARGMMPTGDPRFD